MNDKVSVKSEYVTIVGSIEAAEAEVELLQSNLNYQNALDAKDKADAEYKQACAANMAAMANYAAYRLVELRKALKNKADALAGPKS